MWYHHRQRFEKRWARGGKRRFAFTCISGWTITWCLRFLPDECDENTRIRRKELNILIDTARAASSDLKTFSLFSDFPNLKRVLGGLIKMFWRFFFDSFSVVDGEPTPKKISKNKRNNNFFLSLRPNGIFPVFSSRLHYAPSIDQLFAYLLHKLFSFFNFSRWAGKQLRLSGYVLCVCLLFYQFHSLKNTFYSSFCRPKK